MSALKLAVRFARRELRSGLSGFRIFLASLALGVAAIAGVGSLGEAYLTGLTEQGRVLLGGDVSLRRRNVAATVEERAFMAGYGQVSETTTMRSMADVLDASGSTSGTRALVELKAVDAAYPLVGEVGLVPQMPLHDALACNQTMCGAVVEKTLFYRLRIEVGDILRVGDTDFEIRAELASEPDRISGGFSLGPHFMLSREAMGRTGLITPGSLTNYYYDIAFTGNTGLDEFETAVETAHADGGWRVRNHTNAIPDVARFVRQATMFLTLVGLTALVVGGVGAGQAISAFLQRRRTSIATLKAIGADGQVVFLTYLVLVMTLAALGIVVGLIAGAALPFAVDYFFGDRIPAPANYALYPGPLVLAAAFGVLTAFGFAIVPLARAKEITPAGLFRDLVAPVRTPAHWQWRAAAVLAFMLIAILSVALSPYPRFNLGFLGGTFVVLILLRLVGLGLQRTIARIPVRRKQILRLAFANLTRPGTQSAHVIVALGLGLTLLATVSLTEASVNAQVQDRLPERAPSYFFIDIQRDQIVAFSELISEFPTATEFETTPMMRGRVVALNGVPVAEAEIQPGGRWITRGDRSVTYMYEKPRDIFILDGPDWWEADYDGPTLMSLDRDDAEAVGLAIGDTMTINVLGRDIQAQIFNMFDEDFRSGAINFSFILSPGIVADAPHTFLATVNVDPEQEEAMFAAVSRDFPNISVVLVRDVLAQINEMLQALAAGMRAASMITILAGILVLAGAIAAGHRARVYDAVVLKVLGATRGRLAAVYTVEYGVLGCLAGVAALVIGTLAAWAVTTLVLDVPLVFAARTVTLTIVGGALATLVLGLIGGFTALSAKPAERLRNP